VNHKKRDILSLTITLTNLNRFVRFLYHFNREEILHATLIKFVTSPDLCAHLTWKKIKTIVVIRESGLTIIELELELENLHFCRGSCNVAVTVHVTVSLSNLNRFQ